ncbi:MAG: transketolase family protein, partial [Clostridia bacterium]|nr:transketolase family protein [Clostridia bacterium]
VFAAERPFEQIRNTVAHGAINVKIAATHAGITVGEDGATHQAVEDLALMRVLPGMTVLVPADALGTQEAVRAALEIQGPVYIRLGRSGVPAVHPEGWKMELGKIAELRSGSDLTLLGLGITVDLCLQAAELLAKEGISADVLEVHTLKPLDEAAIIQAAQKTGHLLTVEEHNVIGGLGSAIAEIIAEKAPARLKRLGMPDCFGESGKPAELLQKYGFTPENIAQQAKALLNQ